MMEEWFEKAIKQIAALEDDWDTYGGPKISEATLNAIREAWNKCPKGEPFTYGLAPINDGSVDLEVLLTNDRSVTLIIEADVDGEIAVFSIRNGSMETFADGVSVDDLPRHIENLGGMKK